MFKFSRPAVLSVAFGVALSMLSVTGAAEFSIDREDSGDIVVQIDGKLFTRYVTTDTVTNKCYFWPVIGPSGAPMTRAFPMKDVEGEKQDHPHHRSVCFGLQNAGGYNTWHERLTFTRDGKVDEKKEATLGRQVHTKVVRSEASGNSATLVVECDNTTPDGDVYMRQTRTVNFHVADSGSRVMDIEIALIGVKQGITVVGKKDSGLTVRVAHSMCVDAGLGGRVINSNGEENGKAWGKRVPWVDFNGPVDGKTMGVAMLNHPDSFRHPTPWHVRSYGLFTANPFALKEVAGEDDHGDFELASGQSIVLKHRLIFHDGDEKKAGIAEAWDVYSK
ncbi:MAG: PmoA family protein [Fuerstiella sp.]|nr:PmoA family protein [Fuerstiella sp.]